jgi:hypothetical protein
MENFEKFEEMEGVINTSGEFYDGRINILFHPVNVYDPQDGTTYLDRAIDCINGATISYQGPAEHTFGRHCVKYTLPIDDAKLGDVFETLPYGIMKKNRTGLGATTLELKTKRNSIIVVPTRALAYEKAKQSKNDKGKYNILYVGGKITGFNVPTIENYLADNDIEYKKFIVVVDSLPTLLDKIGEVEYKNYFLMIDEIDSYQNDGWYRDNMEKAIDYYFKFSRTSRCMVSATIGTFSNPFIDDEAITEIIFNKPQPRNIVLQPTDNVVVTTVAKITEIAKQHPNDKILIAYNAVLHGILPVILSLPKELQAECSVLCGEKSKAHVKEYYSEIISNHLPSKITFMTCTYFVGIDIDERFHLVSVATPYLPYTLLSTEKQQQIAGRCRNSEGLLSETIIYQTVDEETSIDYPKLKDEVISDANVIIELNSSIQQVKDKFPQMVKRYNEVFMEDMIAASAKSYYGSSSIKLVRKTESNQLAIAYFNIDNILIQVKLLNTLYSVAENMEKALTAEGNNVTLLPPIHENRDVSDKIKEEISTMKEAVDEQQLSEIIAELRERTTIEDRKYLAMARRNDATNKNGVFLDHFVELQEYVPFEELVRLLPENDTPTSYKHFRNAVLLWALADNHPIKAAWYSTFVVDECYTGDELTNKFNAIWSGVLGYEKLTERAAIPLVRKYLCEVKPTTMRKNGEPKRHYKIMSLNPLGINGKPIKTISNDTDMHRKIKM